MKVTRLNEITLIQYIAIVHGAQVGTGIFSLPKDIALNAGADGWISILIAWAVITLAGCVMLLLLRKFPDDPLPSLLGKIFGRRLGKLALLPFIVYFGCFGWIVMVNSMLYIKAWFLPKTSGFLIILLFAVPTFMLVRNGMRVIGRYAEFILYAMAWMPVFLLFPLSDGHWTNLLPILKDGWTPVLGSVRETLFAFTGMEILFFVYPHLKRKQYAFHGMVIANTLTMLLYTFVTILCYIQFPQDEIIQINQPLMHLLKIIEFRFLERFDMIFFALYLFVVSRSWSVYGFATAYSLGRLFNRENHTGMTVVYLLAILVIVFFSQPTWNQSVRFGDGMTIFNEWMLFVVPVVLLALVQIKALFGRRAQG